MITILASDWSDLTILGADWLVMQACPLRGETPCVWKLSFSAGRNTFVFTAPGSVTETGTVLMAQMRYLFHTFCQGYEPFFYVKRQSMLPKSLVLVMWVFWYSLELALGLGLGIDNVFYLGCKN